MRLPLVFLVVLLAGCGASPAAPSPSRQPFELPVPTPQPATCVVPSYGPDLPPLGPCCVTPNYAYSKALRRRERFPIQVDIDLGSLTLAGGASAQYEQGIRDGLAVWSTATGGAIGLTTPWTGRGDLDLVVRLVARDEDEDCVRFAVCAVGEFVHEDPSGRVLRGGRIQLYQNEIENVLRTNPSSRADIPAYVASLMGHEMGHALGLEHSPSDFDLMAERGPYHSRPFPYVTPADINTMNTAYCR